MQTNTILYVVQINKNSFRLGIKTAFKLERENFFLLFKFFLRIRKF